MTRPDQPAQPQWQAGQYPPPYPPASAPPGFYPPPPKKSFWSSAGGILTIIGICFAALILFCGGLAVLGAASNSNATSKMQVQMTSCEVSGSVAKVGYTVTNNGSRAQRARLDIEYRDSAGARLDTDTAYVGEVPAGDTVRGEESTILNARATSGSCKILRVH